MPFNFQRFNNSLDAHADTVVKERILQGLPSYDSLTTPVQRAQWIGGLMESLNEAVGEETARQVMQACGTQCIGHSLLERARSLQQGCGS